YGRRVAVFHPTADVASDQISHEVYPPLQGSKHCYLSRLQDCTPPHDEDFRKNFESRLQHHAHESDPLAVFPYNQRPHMIADSSHSELGKKGIRVEVRPHGVIR